MKTLKLIPLLAALPFIANANVVLKSDGENLLINEKPAQVTQHLYDADDNLLDNFKIIENEGKSVKAFVTIEGKTGLFKIMASGYIFGNEYHEYDVSGMSSWSNKIYDAECNVIGSAPESFNSLDFNTSGYINALAPDGFNQLKAYDLKPVKGYLSCSETDKVVSGYEGDDFSLGNLNAELATAITNYFQALKFPLSIK